MVTLPEEVRSSHNVGQARRRPLSEFRAPLGSGRAHRRRALRPPRSRGRVHRPRRTRRAQTRARGTPRKRPRPQRATSDAPSAPPEERSCAASVAGQLSAAQKERRDQLIDVVKGDVVAKGRALRSLRDERLYRGTHATLGAFTKEHFGYGAQTAYKYIGAASLAEEIGVALTRQLGVEKSHLLQSLLPRDRTEVARVIVDGDLRLPAARVLVRERRARAEIGAPKTPRRSDEGAASAVGCIYDLDEYTRLACADIKDAQALGQLFGGTEVTVMLTDPPQGLQIEGIANDHPTLLDALYASAFAGVPMETGVALAFLSTRKSHSVRRWENAGEAAGFVYDGTLYLHRPNRQGRPDDRGYISTIDPISRMVMGKPAWPDPSDWHHDVYRVTELEPADLTGRHPTIKPVSVLRDMLSRLPEGPVFDPFAGSGSTLLAARAEGRRSFGVELNPHYCDLIRERFRKRAQ